MALLRASKKVSRRTKLRPLRKSSLKPERLSKLSNSGGIGVCVVAGLCFVPYEP